MSESKFNFKPYGMPWWLCAVTIVIVLASAALGALSTDIAGTVALMLSLAIVFNEIGERIPIWNTYIGGGLVLTFMSCAFLFTYEFIPADYADAIAVFMDDVDFLTFFIVFLITGSILSLERDLLLRSFAGYIPAILGGLAGAAILGIGVGFIFGMDPTTIVIKYVLPIMGGGNGAGAVPLSEIYESVTGEAAATYYSFAITILTIANIFAIITGAILHRIGEMRPEWTGDGSQLIRNGGELATSDKKIEANTKDLGAALFVAVGFYALGRLFSKALLPEIFGIEIHQFAYMIIFVSIAAATGIIPDNIRAGAKRLQSFMTTNLTILVMVGVGADTDIIELLSAINLPNVMVALFIVLGAIFGSAVIGWVVGFYPVDSAVTAGLCMANRGGSGDLAVLGASRRMPLMAYAQLSSRLGGGMVLIIASIVFSLFL